MAPGFNHSYMGGRDQEDWVLKSAWAEVHETPSWPMTGHSDMNAPAIPAM
jgi:hypothetical protein